MPKCKPRFYGGVLHWNREGRLAGDMSDAVSHMPVLFVVLQTQTAGRKPVAACHTHLCKLEEKLVLTNRTGNVVKNYCASILYSIHQ